MKILVDELPVRPSDCPFFVYNGFKECKLDDFEDYECVNVADCPYLKAMEERANADNDE